jgi:hypothetical protein
MFSRRLGRGVIVLGGVLVIAVSVGVAQHKVSLTSDKTATSRPADYGQDATRPDRARPVAGGLTTAAAKAKKTPSSPTLAKPASGTSAPVSQKRTSHSSASHSTKHHTTSGPTSWAPLNAAIARIPTYHSGWVRWVVQDTGWSATADWYNATIYVSRSAPTNRLFDIVVHEWSHILQARDYGGNVSAAVSAMDAYFGGSGLTGAERAADCMAKLQGAQHTAYTSCSNATWKAGARLLLAGQRLP